MRKLGLATALVAALALPAAAPAATLSIKPNAASGGKRVQFLAGPGELNQVNANLFDSRFVFQDSGKPPFSASDGCQMQTNVYYQGQVAECPAQGVDLIDIRLGAEHDYAFVAPMSRPSVPALVAAGPGNDDVSGGWVGDRVFGEGGNDKINGRDGADVLVGGAGDDEIKSGAFSYDDRGRPTTTDDGAIDRIWCGLGFDTVVAHAGDVIAKDCEIVNGERREVEDVLDAPEVPPLDDLSPEIPTILLDIEIDPLAEVLREGLLVTAGCSATCTITPELRVSDKLVKRLKLPAAVVARGGAVRTTRAKRMRLRFSKRVRKILAKQDAVPFVFRASAVDVDGNPFAVETKIRLRAAGRTGPPPDRR
jgi:hypothetical protein